MAVFRPVRWASSPAAVIALGLILYASVAAAAASISAEKDLPEWASSNALQLTLSTKPGLQFTTIPLTENLGLNESDHVRGIVRIYGALKPANFSNYNQIKGQDDIAYLSCDKPSGDNLISPDKMFNDLMGQRPRAILLYSTNRNWCTVKPTEPLPYTSILTMADAGEAGNVQSYLNSNAAGVNAIIQGNATEEQTVNNDSGGGGGGGNNSAVAMSILYSITGLITLLFLIIIATGAIRAHRYPERYGPRGAFGGRPRQSRAKGLARAVLDTIPIVKFGNQQPSKPDPQLELETTSTVDPAVATTTTAKPGTLSRLPEIRPVSADATPRPSLRRRRFSQDSLVSALTVSDMEPDVVVREVEEGDAGDNEGQLGCSICTEDFRVGEDVRVLPCNHQFHPNCVDPWLVNVSGTCPLCRLDLRPGHESAGSGSPAEDGEFLAPPLEAEDGHGGAGSGSHSHSNRFSRFLDVNRLRHASVEERMEALRQMRTRNDERDARDGDAAAGRRAQGQRLTDKLKDKFRIRTRSQAADRRRA
ncbi:hypothetical protein XA68_17573 [Ophiocordyceps unilateralis]|uniref:RING-type domain-containing protein n=1 Tax=Ophiocordyceps unilateralis TaxID=268505 RepID=A0A2A9P4K4_OPHUN|nr:hypothetical protein XA68_17573 [Ophiocordyceps unilateralis]